MAAPVDRSGCNWEGRNIYRPVIHGLKLLKYART